MGWAVFPLVAANFELVSGKFKVGVAFAECLVVYCSVFFLIEGKHFLFLYLGMCRTYM